MPIKKRSKAITLTILTGVTLYVAGCSDDNFLKEPKFFQNKAECSQDLNDPTACAEVEQQALKIHADTAPKFSNVQECEAQFGSGNCGVVPTAQIGQAGQPQPTQASGSSFMPLMMGYMMGQMMSGGGFFGGGQSRYQAEPMYKDKNNSVFGRGGVNAGKWGNATGFSPSPEYKSKISPTTTTRSGGFGNSSNMSATS